MTDKKSITIIFLTFLLITNAFSQSSQNKIVLGERSNDFVEGKTIISELEYIGLDSQYETYEDALYLRDLLRYLSENQVNIKVGEAFNSRKIEEVLVILKKWLAVQGYMKADVVVLGKKLPKNRMNLSFSVNKREPIDFLEVRFDGNMNISEEEYLSNLKECSGDSWKRFDLQKYNFITQKCSRSLMYSKGYFEGKIINISRRMTENKYIVTIKVNEGIRYRIGEIKINGAKVFSEKELFEILGQKEGDIADGKAIRNFFYEKLKEIYNNKGYIYYEAEFDAEFIKPQTEEIDGIVNIKGEIEEGPQFKVSKIRFVGVSEETEKRLITDFSLTAGEILNLSKLKDALTKINETEEFYPLDIDMDVECRTDYDNATVEIFIKLQKQI